MEDNSNYWAKNYEIGEEHSNPEEKDNFVIILGRKISKEEASRKEQAEGIISKCMLRKQGKKN
jgi:hypothetical protein